MGFGVPAADHFEGQANIAKGAKRGTDDTLADILRKFKTGTEAYAAAGDLAVTFDEAFEDTDYTVVFSFEDVSGGANDLVGQIKAGTKLSTGFTVTIAGTAPNGIMHWVAIHD